MNVLEDVIGRINEDVFLKEFSFSRTQFSPVPEKEYEFADSVVWMKGILMLVQAKQRTGRGDPDRWFTKKVVGAATKQVRDTLKYLQAYDRITLTNRRGHEFPLAAEAVQRTVKFVVYDSAVLSESMRKTRHHKSRSAGTIHILTLQDYLNVTKTLATPAEILEYLTFREEVIARAAATLPSEKALVGQFLSGHLDVAPDVMFEEMVDRLKDRREEWDVSHVTATFGDHITFQGQGVEVAPAGPTQYYSLLSELALLSRNDLRYFRERFDRVVEAGRDGKYHVPTRMIADSGCGFLFMAVPAEKAPGRIRGLQNLTMGSKYEQKLERHVGVVVVPQNDELLIDWIFLQFPWSYDPELERMLEDQNPFLPLKDKMVPKYRFLREMSDDADE